MGKEHRTTPNYYIHTVKVGWVGKSNRQASAGKERVTGKHEGRIEGDLRATVRMWIGGPLRQMAATKVSNAFIPFARTINGCSFAGRYVCDECQGPCGGVSLQNDGKMSGNRHSGWLCDLCIRGKQRKTLTPDQKQAVIDRLAGARRDRTTIRIQEGRDAAMCNAVAAVAAEANPLREGHGIM